MSELPEGWSLISLKDIAKVEWGNTNITKKSYVPAGYPAFSASGSDGFLSKFEWEGTAVILSAIGARCGKCFYAQEKWTAIKNTIVIQGDEKCIDHKLLYYYFNDESKWSISGSGQPFITMGTAQETLYPLPPLNEQRRIAAKLEELLERVDACRKRLGQVPRLLKQFRQSILVAACSGSLTSDWREVNKAHPASILLEEILKERRKKWEGDQLEKMLLSAKQPKDDKWKDKYVEPVAPDPSGLDELPEGWIWGTWNQISNWVTYGFTRPMPHVERGIPIVTAKHVVNRKIHTTGTDSTTEKAFKELSEKDRPQLGDILVTKDGSIGRTAIVETEEPFCINQSVAVVWLRSLTLERSYLLYVIESPFTQRRVVERVRGNAIQHLSITDFAATPLPIPSRHEQVEIIRRVEALFKIADAVEDRYRKAQEQLDKLPQSILAKAFRGELVPQDPGDEPASVLLERIRTEKAANGKPEKKIKRPAVAKSKTAAGRSSLF